MPTQTKKNMIRTAAATVLAAGSLSAVAGSAQAAVELPEFEIDVNRNAIERTIEAAKHRRDYRQAYEQAEKLKVEPENAALSTELAPRPPRPAPMRSRRRSARRRSPSSARPSRLASRPRRSRRSPPASPVATRRRSPSDGTYRGKYQFDMQTWASQGGSGDPAAASEEEQDYRAALLYSAPAPAPGPSAASEQGRRLRLQPAPRAARNIRSSSSNRNP